MAATEADRATIAALPCPFCGGKARISTIESLPHYGFCTQCGVRGGQYNTVSPALAAWNRRHPDPRLARLIVRCEELVGMLEVAGDDRGCVRKDWPINSLREAVAEADGQAPE